MKPEIKELLYNLTGGANVKKLLHEAYGKMDSLDISICVDRLLFWNRVVCSGESDYGQYFEKEYLLIGAEIERFSKLFEYSPVLFKVFAFDGKKVIYNEELTEDEIREIRKYIYDRRRKKRFIFGPRIRQKKE
ncbi:hypothetical protein SAMN04489761_2802 [Tenacibaculum sp. MAR_2009_124]|uniref:hypothetical protein n=1 Tax=Tenacibaculum sp. MAR_2009_124 TaxID=1250059 RepID=UPI0008959959|nr:hypothetical protein [Tenacibaculum sp. MAR_2009_124]SEC37031.1 hypothetical protein SAMN04489761_2802 [Tenacibaculum sp. MAR_2009_124]